MPRCPALLLILIPALVSPALAEDGASPDHEERIRKLEQENEVLRERLDRVESREDDTLEQDIEEYVEQGLGLDLVIRRGRVHGIFQIFGDVGVRYDNPEVPGRSNTFFFNGSIDFFLTARVGDHFHVLSETVFLTSIGEPKDGSDFDQERLWAAWNFSDLLQIKIGLEHDPVSRWNRLFHHGRWLELTIDRPFLARFEGGGGILAMHDAGVEFAGALATGLGQLRYIVIVANGRGPVPTDTQEFSDRNDDKAIVIGLIFEPEGVTQALHLGLFFRTESIPPDFSNPARAGSIREHVGSFQVDYRGDRVEIMMEFVFIQNRDRVSGLDFEHYSAYFQLGYHYRERWTPYFRIDFREMDQGDPYFAPLDRDLDIWELLFGVRFDLVTNASIKFEVGFGDRESRNGAGAVRTRGYIRIGMQVAWVF